MLNSSLSALESTMDQQNNTTDSSSSRRMWHRVLRPTVVLAVGSPVILLVNIGLVIVFLLRENWQGVILSSVAFIAWTQVVYWYFRARSLLQPSHQARSGASHPETTVDVPPPYEEVIKTEAPPPPYYMVVSEGGWSSGTYGSASHANKESLPYKKSRSSGSGDQQAEEAGNVCVGITAPYIHHITSDEHSHASTTSSTLFDHAQVIRAPINREIRRLAVPTHKPTPTRSTARDTLPDAGCGAVAS